MQVKMVSWGRKLSLGHRLVVEVCSNSTAVIVIARQAAEGSLSAAVVGLVAGKFRKSVSRNVD